MNSSSDDVVGLGGFDCVRWDCRVVISVGRLVLAGALWVAFAERAYSVSM